MYCYVDFETEVDSRRGLSLRKKTLPAYLEQARVLTVAWAVDDGPVKVARHGTDAFYEFIEECSHQEVFVAHHASFDARVWFLKLGLPWPKRVHCTLELAQYWTVNQPGGYGLDNLTRVWLGEEYHKGSIDFNNCTDEELDAYCAQDVEGCRALHKLALKYVPDCEFHIHEMCQRCKEVMFRVDTRRVAQAVTDFSRLADEAADDAISVLGSDESFGRDGASIRSVKPIALRQQLLEDLGFDVPTTSLKQLNPETLRRHAEGSRVIHAVAETNKALSHKRRVSVFSGCSTIPMELTYFAASTGRMSSRSAGRGLNLHNQPKRNKRIASIIRPMFRLPDDLCFVSVDFANVEYRIEGWLSQCQSVLEVFEKDPLADPYSAFWYQATGQTKHKGDPERDGVAKAAVLGLGFFMSVFRWTSELLKAVSDPTFGVTSEDIFAIAADNNWSTPRSRAAKAAVTKLRCDPRFGGLADATYDLFHRVHREYGQLTRWLLRTCQNVMSAADPHRAVELMYQDPCAPDRDRLDLWVDTEIQGRSIMVRCGRWPARTVMWRDLGVRDTLFGPGMTAMQAGNKGWRALTKNIVIENVVQSCARNGLCEAMRRFDAAGYPYIPSVHDQLMLIVPRTRERVLRARDDIIRLVGPGNDLGYGWAVLAKPGDITLSESLYEDEDVSAQQWAALEAGDESVLRHLT